MKQPYILIIILTMLSLSLYSSAEAQSKKQSTSLFRAINCQVSNTDGAHLQVSAYRNMKNANEIILISKNADHALLIDLKKQVAYKVAKPFPGTNAVAVSDDRPNAHGNLGFMTKNGKDKKDITEIIVHFQNDSCFLCGPQSFASVWD